MIEIKNIKERWPTKGMQGGTMNSAHALDSRFYPHYADHWDDRIFREVILRHIRKDSFILDLGAGSGYVEQMNFRGTSRKMCGLDPDPSVLGNPHLDEAKVGSGEAIPWPDQIFDVVFADNVLEHLSNPEAVFREVLRVLKPGGCFLAKTPNRFHYVTLIAQLTPTSFHEFFNRLRGRNGVHTFKTYYGVNSRNAIAKLAKKCGFELRDLQCIEGRPEYLRFSVPSYYFGMAWERVVNRFEFLSGIRVLIVAVLQKPREVKANS
jgi:SAM-dependent methyltransferase